MPSVRRVYNLPGYRVRVHSGPVWILSPRRQDRQGGKRRRSAAILPEGEGGKRRQNSGQFTNEPSARELVRYELERGMHEPTGLCANGRRGRDGDRKSTRLNSS